MLSNLTRIRRSPLLLSSPSRFSHILSSRPVSLTGLVCFFPRTDPFSSVSHLHETFPKKIITVTSSREKILPQNNSKRGDIGEQAASTFEGVEVEGLSEEEKKKFCEIYEGWSEQHKKMLRGILDNPTEEQKKKITQFLESFGEEKMKGIRMLNDSMKHLSEEEKMLVVALVNLGRRFGFLRRVISILEGQLLLSSIVYAAIKMCPPITIVLKENYFCLFSILFTGCMCFLPTSQASKIMGIIRKKSTLKNSIQGLLNVATISLGVVLVDIHLANSNGIIMLAALIFTLAISVFLVLFTFCAFVVYHEDLSSVGSPVSSKTMLIVLPIASFIQIVNPGPITAAIEMGLYGLIFSLFVMCHTWMILKRYDQDEYMMASSNLLLHMFGLFIFSTKALWMISRPYIWAYMVLGMITAFIISSIKSLYGRN